MLLALALLCLGVPSLALAETFAVQSETLVRLLERDTMTGSDKTVLPVYEYLRLDYSHDPARKVVFRAYGWGRADLTDSGYFDEAGNAELLYAYLQYKPNFRNAVIRLGRQQVYSGTASDAIDGIRYASDLGARFNISLHAGQPVGYAETAGRSGDLLLGGRLGHRSDDYAIGLAYQLLRDDSTTIEQIVGLDFNLVLPAEMRFDGLVSYNFESDGLAEQNYALHLPLLEADWRLFFEAFSYDDYFPKATAAPQPFRSLAGSGETLYRYGATANRRFDETWEAGLKLTGYSYDDRNDSAVYGAALLAWHGESLQQIGGEAGYLDAAPIDDDQFLLRLFAYWDQLPDAAWLDFVAADVVYAAYGKGFFGTTSSLFSSVSSGKNFLDNRLTLKLSVDASSDPYFDDDLRGMLALTYRYPN